MILSFTCLFTFITLPILSLAEKNIQVQEFNDQIEDHAKNPYLGDWCATKENSSDFYKFTFNSDDTMTAFGHEDPTKVEWTSQFNPKTGLIAIVVGLKEAASKGPVEIFDISADGNLIWIGNAFKNDLPNITRENLNQYLINHIYNARDFPLVYERCGYLGS